jgi:hypothetical protein
MQQSKEAEGPPARRVRARRAFDCRGQTATTQAQLVAADPSQVPILGSDTTQPPVRGTTHPPQTGRHTPRHSGKTVPMSQTLALTVYLGRPWAPETQTLDPFIYYTAGTWTGKIGRATGVLDSCHIHCGARFRNSNGFSLREKFSNFPAFEGGRDLNRARVEKEDRIGGRGRKI